jgi:hypothetical protein
MADPALSQGNERDLGRSELAVDQYQEKNV